MHLWGWGEGCINALIRRRRGDAFIGKGRGSAFMEMGKGHAFMWDGKEMHPRGEKERIALPMGGGAIMEKEREGAHLWGWGRGGEFMEGEC